jgi:hypothetical protein
MPRGIGLVTSPGAAALHDVVTALRRRVPHIPVVLVPALVQGAAAPQSLVRALSKLYLLAWRKRGPRPIWQRQPAIDVILLVRGGGSIEDLWAFNDEQLARTIVQSPVPLICGVGHETDFTIADFCADLRAPTPTGGRRRAGGPAARSASLPAQSALDFRLRAGPAVGWWRARCSCSASCSLKMAACATPAGARGLGEFPQKVQLRSVQRLDRAALRLQRPRLGAAPRLCLLSDTEGHGMRRQQLRAAGRWRLLAAQRGPRHPSDKCY